MKAANLSLAAGITILMLPGILRTAEPELVTLSAEGEAKMVIAIPEAKNQFGRLRSSCKTCFAEFPVPILKSPRKQNPDRQSGCKSPNTPFLPPQLRSKGGFKALPPKANS